MKFKIKLIQSPLLKLLVIPCILFFILIFRYSIFAKTMPVTHWDEALWVGRSYFFDLYIHGDFDNQYWQSYDSYDQPKLAEYSYGAWLYPYFLQEKAKSKSGLNYMDFLTEQGFSETDKKDSGFTEYYVDKYGASGLKFINLIYRARLLNLLLLAGAVIFAYFFALEHFGVLFAMFFSIFYGFNSLIINSGLRAHSEALFLFTFNAAMFFMTLYFSREKKSVHLLLFSLFSGLCMSTKLNGSMLLIMFFIVNIIMLFLSKEKSKEKKVKQIWKGVLPILISLIIFISLNPFTFSNPIVRVRDMFVWRMKTAISQSMRVRKKELSLPNGMSRIGKIFENFYYSKQEEPFNSIRFFEQQLMIKNYQNYMLIVFILGLFYSFKLILNKNKFAIIFISSFVITLALMAYYLKIDWPRYYAHLSFFFIMLQSLGLFFAIKYVYQYLSLFLVTFFSSRPQSDPPQVA